MPGPNRAPRGGYQKPKNMGKTISRLLGRFQKSGMLAVKGKYITIENNDALAQLAGHTRNVA